MDALIEKLQKELDLTAREALQKPGDGSSFEYGRRVGTFAGLSRALELLEELLQEEEGTEHGTTRRGAKRWQDY